MTGRCPYEYLKQDVWFQLLARAVLFHAVRVHIETLHDRATRSDSVQHVVHGYYLSAADGAADAQGTTGIDAVLADFCTRARAVAARRGTKPPDAELLTDLARLAEDAVVQDPFARMLERVNDLAAREYGRGWRKPELSLARVTENPSRPVYPVDPYPITGSTFHKPKLTVELVLDPDGFGPATYAAMPMVLVHECVCHVAAAQRGETCNESTFAEGFMDYAAQYFFDAWIGRIDRDLAPAAREHAPELVHKYLQPGNPDADVRQDGLRAARKLRAWLESPDGLNLRPTSGPTAVADLAVDLNRVNEKLIKKDQLVATLNQPSYPPEVQSVLKGWYAGSTPASDLFIVQEHRK